MPKSKPSRRKASGAHTTPATKRPTPKVSRRAALSTFAVYGAGAALLAGGGAVFARDFRSKLAEADLSKIGQGEPTIVQIHDPSCRLCQALQRETRNALKDCDEAYTYLVANITTRDGAEFAARMGQPHVTLALLDGDGTPLHFVHGVTPADSLKSTFQQYFG